MKPTEERSADRAEQAVRRSSLVELLAPIRGALILALGVQFVAALATVVPFIAVSELSMAAIVADSFPVRTAWTWAIVAAVALTVRAVAVMSAGSITHYADNDLQLDLRRKLVARLTRVPLGWFSHRSAGAVKKAVADDVVEMHHLVAHAALEIVSAVVIPVAMLAYLFSVDWRLTSTLFIPIAIGMALYARRFAVGKDAWQEFSVSTENVNGSAVEFVQGIAVMKTFGGASRASSRFLATTRAHAELFYRMSAKSNRSMAVGEIVLATPTTLMVVLVAGLAFAERGWVSTEDVVPFVVLGLGVLGPLFGMWSAANTLMQARTASQRVRDLLATPVLTFPSASPVLESSRLELRNVGFSYHDGHAALNDVSFVLEPGTVTALVGRSGAGKSTVSRLIPRFWDPAEGSVLLGGVDLRDLTPKELYRHISFVFQDVQLLRASVRENIALARPGADHAAVEQAARIAQIHQRISALPHGYDTIIGDETQLSGGEAQRVSIARALVADTPILVLDEATAFADPESEAQIQDALSELAVGRTMLVIAHRLSTVRNVDQIVVLDGGKVAETGTHDQLVAAGGVYAGLWHDHERAKVWTPRLSLTEESIR
ncbi:ABC transporter ATP-binding protein [Rhodococcus ruber]|uniref:ABC transporter ATP-binding protein n=1 Tax=Rhodococcus ruber TaxID=1830 RepID=A0ABT4MES4_9NOCA|nr:ABC transporter ATP-binding protein [Rhodococcus ruber]MCZ4519493.1 ABC transporter ATP-binding protein [Rhodococcus ruber]